MKLASYSHGSTASYGIVDGDGIIDLGSRLGPECPTLKAALAGKSLSDLASAAAGAAADHSLAAIQLLPVIPEPGKIICVGLNYKAHIEETGNKPPAHPILFNRFADSVVGHGADMISPNASTAFDFEGEFAMVIGAGGRHISEADALSAVAGYTCFNDGSVRDWQFHTSQFLPGKNFFHSGACGPWMVTADEIPDPNALTLKTRLNGEEMQNTPVDDLLFGPKALIAYISTFTELNAGDIIATGTPGGVGNARDPKVFMKAGDKIEVEVSSVGILSNDIVAE